MPDVHASVSPMRFGLPALLLLLSCVPAPLVGQGLGGAPTDPSADRDTPFFYDARVDYGSAAQFSPLSVVLSRGFSTVVWRGAERRLTEIDWSQGFSTAWDAVRHPVGAIERRGGWRDFFATEFGPFSSEVRTWAFAPNWGGHTIAGGITYRALAEWYEARDVPLPSVMGAATVMGAIFINETLEGQRGGPGHASTVADLFFFEPLGIVLFSFDGVARFFSRTLNAADWSPQASITVSDLRLQNVGQVMSYHFPLPGMERLNAMILLGQGSEAGLLWDVDQEYSVGVGMGFVAASRVLDANSKERLDARLAGGLYFARNNSLLASLNVARGTYSVARLNVFPGVGWGLPRQLGVWVELNREREFSFGLTLRSFQGLGLGYDVRDGG